MNQEKNTHGFQQSCSNTIYFQYLVQLCIIFLFTFFVSYVLTLLQIFEKGSLRIKSDLKNETYLDMVGSTVGKYSLLHLNRLKSLAMKINGAGIA